MEIISQINSVGQYILRKLLQETSRATGWYSQGTVGSETHQAVGFPRKQTKTESSSNCRQLNSHMPAVRMILSVRRFLGTLGKVFQDLKLRKVTVQRDEYFLRKTGKYRITQGSETRKMCHILEN